MSTLIIFICFDGHVHPLYTPSLLEIEDRRRRQGETTSITGNSLYKGINALIRFSMITNDTAFFTHISCMLAERTRNNCFQFIPSIAFLTSLTSLAFRITLCIDLSMPVFSIFAMLG